MPAVSNVTDAVAPPLIVPVSNPSPVAVWPTPSLFVQVTVSPTETVTVPGENANPEIVDVAIRRDRGRPR